MIQKSQKKKKLLNSLIKLSLKLINTSRCAGKTNAINFCRKKNLFNFTWHGGAVLISALERQW